MGAKVLEDNSSDGKEDEMSMMLLKR